MNLPDRLREHAAYVDDLGVASLMSKAADEIERLTKENRKLRELVNAELRIRGAAETLV